MSNKAKRAATPPSAKRASGRRPAPVKGPADPGGSGPEIRKWVIRGVIVAAIAALAAVIVLNQPEELEDPENVQAFEITETQHVNTAIEYPQDPPAGGPHHPLWQECGFYPVPINSENAVHVLEHGAVWITYDPALDEDSIDRLRDFAGEPEVLVSAYPGLDAPVVASSWGYQLRLEGADDPDLEAFVVNFKNRSAPELSAGCNDGRGTTDVA